MSYWPFNATITRVVILIGALIAIAVLSVPAYQLAFAQEGPIEYPENGNESVAIFAAGDPEGGMVLWSLGGDDADDFQINGGVLSFKYPPDYENPTSAVIDGLLPARNMYNVTVRASDGGVDWSVVPVVVEVTNLNEMGTVTLSSLQPQSGIVLVATLTDPEGVGDVGDVGWEWAKSNTAGGTFVPIPPPQPNPNPNQYTVKDRDIGMFLRATAKYMETEGAEDADDEQSAEVVSANPAWAARTDITVPAFEGPMAMRAVPENTAAGGLVGVPVAATDASPNDVLTYSLTGSFDIDPATGQIKVGASTVLDHETAGNASYPVTVTVLDTSGETDTVEVTITVTDVDEAPTVTGMTVFTVAENMDDLSNTPSDYTYTKADPELYTTEWDLSGLDASDFEISDAGALSFKEAPDFENPMGGARGDSNVYQVTVEASDGVNTGMLAVSVKVTDADDGGKVALSADRPEVGATITATLTDDDGGVTGVTWQWHRSSTADTTGDEIEDADESEYKPVAADADRYLHAVASYTDSKGASTATGVTENMVRADTANRPPMFLDEDDEVVTAYERSVAEDRADMDDRTDPATVGAPVTAANNANGSYTLSGRDASTFMMDANTGQISAPTGTELDHEEKDTYTVIVTAAAPSGLTSSVTVTINVMDLDELPELEGDESKDYPENGTDLVATYTAMDPERGEVLWSLGGTEAGMFSINGGVLRFKNPPDYGVDNTHEVTVRASDGGNDWSEIEVTVMVTDVDEPGTITLSSLQPQAGEVLTVNPPGNPAVTDPDGNVTVDTWQWAKSRSARGSFVDIATATTATYTPNDDDVDDYLRATAVYTDTSGTGNDEASAISANRVRGAKFENVAPAFPTETGTRSVVEDAAPGALVGGPVTATDGDVGDVLTYSLTGANTGSFDIDPATGQIKVGASTVLDHEMEINASYPVTVTVRDTSAQTDTVAVTIIVTDVDETPTVSGMRQFTVAENLGDLSTTLGDYRYTVMDAEGYTTECGLSGPDASDFKLDEIANSEDCALSFKEAPDFENPMGGARGDSNVYQVTVEASDGVNTGMLAVSVKVTDADDGGKVALSADRPEVGATITATLTDDDGGVTGVTWQWHRSSTADTTGDEIEDADESEYKPVAADADRYLHAVASYTDSKGASTATGVTENMVRADTANRPPMFLDEDDEVVTAYERSVAEDRADMDDRTDPATVGAPVTAEDVNTDDTLTYRLSGTDADAFMMDAELAGQIRAPSGTELDHETKDMYTVIVTATDSSGASSSVTVTIYVTDVDEMPELERVARGLAVTGIDRVDYAENDIGEVAKYSATGSQAAGATWSLEGTDASAFRISAGGVLSFRTSPDYENPMATDNVYMVTVKADDGTYMDEQMVTVIVTNEIELGTLTGMASVDDYAENGMNAVETYTADGPVTPAWSLSGDDADDFSIGSGMLMFRATPDFEAPTDMGMDNMYMVTVMAEAGGEMDMMAVTVMVTDVEEDGTVSMSPERPGVGDEVTAMLTDPDGVVSSSEMWQWSKSMDMTTWMEIEGATMASYTPVAADNGYYLRATVNYTDGYGSDMAMADSMAAVSSIAIQGMASPPDYAENGMDVLASYTATGVHAAGVVWSLTGDDAAEFMVTDGMLSFTTPPDYENPSDMGEDNTYMVTVVATSASDAMVSDILEVTVTVTNVDEPGMVTLWASSADPLTMAPQVGETITGAVMDPDNPDNDATVDSWQWSRTMDTADTSSWMEITDATEAAYMVTEGDIGYYLRVMATYTDAVGMDMDMEDSMPTLMVAPVGGGDHPLVTRFDYNRNGQIDKSDVVDAINAYLDEVEGISKTDVIDLINYYLDS